MKRSVGSFALGASIVVLLALHLFPPRGGPEPMLFGIFPWDLAWHLGWMALATVVVFVMTSTRHWPDADDDP